MTSDLSLDRHLPATGTNVLGAKLGAGRPDVMEHKPLILIVDDEAELARTVAYSFEQEGFATRHAESGQGAVEMALQSPTPDLILLDLMLPDLNGTEVFTAWTFTRHGWGLGFATPSAPIDAAFWDHLLLFAVLWGGALGGGTLYASRKARPIVASLESLEEQAEHVAAGGRIERLPDSGVAEVNSAHLALERASAVLQSATQERDRSLATEREARAVAEAANLAKDEFLAMLGHELRNPLAAIANASAILKDAPDHGRIALASEVIDRQARHLKRLLDDLLDVGRATTGKVILDLQPVDVAVCARAVVVALQTAKLFAERSVHLDTLPVFVDGDSTRIEQILTNLLVNAVRHTSAGGRIDVRVAREGAEAVVVVTDDGRGIAAEHVSRVFDLFFQADSTADRAAGGLGIGLTLVQRLVQLHGGSVTAASDGPGAGATFTVRMPAIAPPAPCAEPAPAPRLAGSETILVAEDNADARATLCLALELRGHHVLQAADGIAALDLLRRERPDIAVVDIGLPGMDGYEVARIARKELGRAPILIAVSGYGTARDAQGAVQAGFDRHLAKPVQLDELLQTIERAKRSADRSG